jgi:predicted dehydrogenase
VNRLRTVLVGFGKVAAGYAEDPLTARYFPYASHAQVLSRHPAFAWEAVVDPDPAARSAARERWGIRHVAATPGELDKSFAPEVAVVATPPERREGGLDAWPALRAVLVEKPLGVTLDGARRWVDGCRARKLLVQVNFWRRADDTMRRLVSGQLDERIGRPQAVFGVYGNGLLNNGSHVVDTLRFLFGEPERVEATGAATNSPYPPGDVDVDFRVQWPGGLASSVAALDFKHYREVGLDIWGERGRLAILNEGLSILQYPRQPHRAMRDANEIAEERGQTLPATAGTALYRLYDNLAGALAGREALWSPAESALRTSEIVDRIRNRA